MVCMFGPTSDEYDLLHRGTRVRKMHSSVPLHVPDPERHPARQGARSGASTLDRDD
jgi:hypothetical protein